MTSETRCATAVEALMTASTGTYSRQGVEMNIGQMPKQNLQKANLRRRCLVMWREKIWSRVVGQIAAVPGMVKAGRCKCSVMWNWNPPQGKLGCSR
jgi:hypothetical protein